MALFQRAIYLLLMFLKIPIITTWFYVILKDPFTHSRFSLRFTTIHPDFSWSEKSGWIGMNRGEK